MECGTVLPLLFLLWFFLLFGRSHSEKQKEKQERHYIAALHNRQRG
jgi:hypothetical protein